MASKCSYASINDPYVVDPRKPSYPNREGIGARLLCKQTLGCDWMLSGEKIIRTQNSKPFTWRYGSYPNCRLIHCILNSGCRFVAGRNF